MDGTGEIILSEVSQAQEAKNHIVFLMQILELKKPNAVILLDMVHTLRVWENMHRRNREREGSLKLEYG
jgi:hypothetical protein